jgi:hypothetical protein
MASQCLQELCEDEECRKSAAMQAAVPAMLSFVNRQLPKCGDAEHCGPALIHVLRTLVSMSAVPG